MHVPARIAVMRKIVVGVLPVLAALALGACAKSKDASAVSRCIAYPPEVLTLVANGFIDKAFRIANGWSVESGTPIDSAGKKVNAYFMSADIVASNGEAVVGTWLTNDPTRAGKFYSVSPQAVKYTNWGHAGDVDTKTISMDTPGAKESIDCVLQNRKRPGQQPTA
ncbi:MAG: hypothetical protein ABI408_00185 [Gemmatimonadaceae bacterium]